ncbi:MAG: RDD family protein [Planctomycetota bacterium]
MSLAAQELEGVASLARGWGRAVVLTPEHVPIVLVPAGLGSRFAAVLVDSLFVMALAMLVRVVANIIMPLGLGPALAATAVFVLTWGYHVYFEVRRGGQTPGKRLFRLRVVDGRGLPITPQQSFVRNIARALDFAPVFYFVGGAVGLLDARARRIGDIAADTLVIKESTPVDYAKQLADARRFNSLRTPRVMRWIRHRVGLEEREFLLALCVRAASMDDRRRFDLMEEVGAHYRETLEIEDPNLSGENIVRGLTAILYGG